MPAAAGDGDAPLAVSLGDPAGIGPEIVAKAWDARERARLPPFFAVGDARAIDAVWDGPVARIVDPPRRRAAFADALPVLQVEDAGEIVPGSPTSTARAARSHSLELAVGLARSGAAGALVTGPVSKAQLYAIGFTHPGPDRIRRRALRRIARDNAVMMLAGPTLRVVPITTHVAAARRAGAADDRPDRRQGARDRARADAQFRHRSAAPRLRRASTRTPARAARSGARRST